MWCFDLTWLGFCESTLVKLFSGTGTKMYIPDWPVLFFSAFIFVTRLIVVLFCGGWWGAIMILSLMGINYGISWLGGQLFLFLFRTGFAYIFRGWVVYGFLCCSGKVELVSFWGILIQLCSKNFQRSKQPDRFIFPNLPNVRKVPIIFPENKSKKPYTPTASP